MNYKNMLRLGLLTQSPPASPELDRPRFYWYNKKAKLMIKQNYHLYVIHSIVVIVIIYSYYVYILLLVYRKLFNLNVK